MHTHAQCEIFGVAFAHGFWARRVACSVLGCCVPALLGVLAAAAGHAILSAKTPGPCARLPRNPRTNNMWGWITLDCLAQRAPNNRWSPSPTCHLSGYYEGIAHMHRASSPEGWRPRQPPRIHPAMRGTRNLSREQTTRHNARRRRFAAGGQPRGTPHWRACTEARA